MSEPTIDEPPVRTDDDPDWAALRPVAVVVQLVQDINVDAFDDLAAAARERDLVDLAARLDELELTGSRLVTAVPVRELRRQEADRRRRGVPDMPSLVQFWRIDLSESRYPAERVAEILQQAREVELAYVETPVVPAGSQLAEAALDEPPLDERRVRMLAVQLGSDGYLDPAPDGVNARWAWTQPGAGGRWSHGGQEGRTRVIDVECGWVFDHEALAQLSVPLLPTGINEYLQSPAAGGHGTSVLGVLAGTRVRTSGVEGICRDAGLLAASHYNGQPKPTAVPTVKTPYLPANLSNAIAAARTASDAGDIVLLEVTTLEGKANRGHRPVERDPGIQLAIRNLTADGIIVIEAAGNGGRNLDTLGTAYNRTQMNTAGPGFDDSGALMVGGANAACTQYASGEGHERWMDFFAGSNYGSRVDCYAWAQEVRTSGYGSNNVPADPATAYCAFGGTSAASAIIAGAAASIQSMYRAVSGLVLTPADIRALFTDPNNGTPSGPGQRIGMMPDLQKVAAALSLPS